MLCIYEDIIDLCRDGTRDRIRKDNAMSNEKQITIANIPEISAIYFALLQCGYDYYHIERDSEHNDAIRGFAGCGAVPDFFSAVKQNTCKVYPYWPRAAMLENASFYIQPDYTQFKDYDIFRERIMSADNISDVERNASFWKWLLGFPAALGAVLCSDGFYRYMKWENEWITEQNVKYENELRLIQECLNVCMSKYDSPVQDIQILLNPIKCVYSADYYLIGNSFIFSSGAFRADSVIHEFLHHVVHPVVIAQKGMVLQRKTAYPGIDASYYLSGDDAGHLNAFEEYAVRELTRDVLTENFPDSLSVYLERIT